MTKWDEKAKRNAVQSGKGPGEFGPDYSHRKRYQLGEVPVRKQYEPHPIEPWTAPKKDNEGYEYRKSDRDIPPAPVFKDPDIGPDQFKDGGAPIKTDDSYELWRDD